MRSHETDFATVSTTPGPGDHALRCALEIASKVKDRWAGGEPADLAAVLATHPTLKDCKSVVLDLAYTEYCHRVAAGEPLEAEAFAQRFPTLQRSLYLLIEVQRLLSEAGDASALPAAVQWPAPGEELLGFLLIAELGRGTFARVFLASEPALGNRLVALKVAPRGGAEAEMLGKLRHPNIVPVYSVQEDRATGLTAVCMPYLGRATLADLLDRAFAASGPPADARVVLDTIRTLNCDCEIADSSFDRILRSGSYVEAIMHFGAQLADALAHAHARGICHGDLKPSNVLIAMDGRPLLLDFNLSADEQMRAGRIGGTLPYMAPEQLRAMASQEPLTANHADPKSDLFALGVVLYQLVSGDFPFGPIPWDHTFSQTAAHLLRQQQAGPRPLRAGDAQPDKRFAQLIARCLAFDPQGRPETAAALAGELRRQLAFPRRVGRWIRGHRLVTAAAASLTVAAALAGTAALAIRDPYPTRQFRRGLQYAAAGEPQRALPCFTESIQADPANPDALLARARAYQELGDFRMAFADFREAFRLSQEPLAAACMGYCLSKMNYHKEAIDSYRNASDLGYNSAAMLNNMGFSYIQIRRLDAAEECLQRAVELDSELQIAYHNLVIVSLNRALGGQGVPEQALGYARRSLATGEPSADAYVSAAALYAVAGQQDPRWIRPAIEHLERAYSLGFHPSSLRGNPVFSALQQEPEFQSFLAKPAPARSPVKGELLVPVF